MIRIDIHPVGKIWYTWHIRFPRQSTYATHTLPAGGPHTWQPFMLAQQSWIDSLLPRKSAPDSTSQPDWVAHGTRFSFSPKHNHWSIALKPSIIDEQAISVYWPISINTFNTCSRRPTHRSLTDTGGDYSLEGADLPHHTPRSSQLTVLHFSAKGPDRSPV
jgi:hypothetical protein